MFRFVIVCFTLTVNKHNNLEIKINSLIARMLNKAAAIACSNRLLQIGKTAIISH
jgi:hypothetical protein